MERTAVDTCHVDTEQRCFDVKTKPQAHKPSMNTPQNLKHKPFHPQYKHHFIISLNSCVKQSNRANIWKTRNNRTRRWEHKDWKSTLQRRKPKRSSPTHLFLLLLFRNLQSWWVSKGGGLAVGAVLHLGHLKRERGVNICSSLLMLLMKEHLHKIHPIIFTCTVPICFFTSVKISVALYQIQWENSTFRSLLRPIIAVGVKASDRKWERGNQNQNCVKTSRPTTEGMWVCPVLDCREMVTLRPPGQHMKRAVGAQ